jgi:16S rRNA (guanine527-N7)-methyltransferase
MSVDERAPLALPSPPALSVPAGFREHLVALGAPLDESALARLGDYLARLLAANALMNLTAIAEPAAAWERHAADALSLVPLLAELPAGARVADVGSGGGLPGFPLAIARPDLHFVLIESTQKKARFLSDVAAALGFANVEVSAERAEVLAKGPLGGSFDVVTARAVARLSALLPLTAPLAKEGGTLLLVKGQRAEEELAEAARLLGKLGVTHERTVATPTGRIVVLRKRGAPKGATRMGRR